MMLKNVIPVEEIQNRLGVPVIYKEYGHEEINKIIELNPETCHQIGLSVWDKIIEEGRHNLDPQSISKHVNNQDPKIYMKISNLIKQPVINDIFYSCGEVESGFQNNQVFEVLLAHVYPNDLYLADILMQNPKRPIKSWPGESPEYTHHGFELLGVVMNNVENLASKLGCKRVSLTAAKLAQVDLFKRYGFSIRNSPAGRFALEYGMGVPMEKCI